MARNILKWLEGLEWLEMVGNGWKCMKLAQSFMEMDGNGWYRWNWLELAGNDMKR